MIKRMIKFMIIVSVMCLIVACTSDNEPEVSQTPVPSNDSGIENAGKYDPPIEMTFALGRLDSDVNLPAGQTPQDNQWTRVMEEELGINIDVTLAMASSDEYTQNLNAFIVTNQLPDLFNVSDSIQMDQIIRSGLAEDLTDVFYEHASPLVREFLPDEVLDLLKVDGKLYFIPHLMMPEEDGDLMWIRSDWLEQLNLPEPETFQDVLDIAQAFKAMDPERNYGFQASSSIYDAFGLSGFFAAHHAYPHAWIQDVSGNIVSGAIQPEMKTALQALQELRSEGMLSHEWMIDDGGEKGREDLINGKVGIVYGKWWLPSWPLYMTRENDPNVDWKPYTFVSADDEPALHVKEQGMLSAYYVLRAGYEHPEALIKMLNLQAELSWGEDPIVEPPGSGLWKVAPVTSEPWGKNIQFHETIKVALESGDTSGLHPDALQVYESIKEYLDEGNQEYWADHRNSGTDGALGLYNVISENDQWINNEYYGSPTETMASHQANLDRLFQETVIKIINGADINTFDSFVEQWKEQGGDDITQELNERYN